MDKQLMPIKLLQLLLDKQDCVAVASGNWDRLEYHIDEDEDGLTTLRIDSVRIGFSFDKSGRFLGVFNWQD